MREILKMNHLTIEFGEQTLLEKVNLSVQEGEVIGVIGKNGAGKSTLLHAINGTQMVSRGEIKWQRPVKPLYIVQEEQAYDVHLAANEELLSKWRVPKGNYNTLSGGEKLKLRLARGFTQASELLLLDEPTNHLDTESIALLLDQIREYEGTIIVASHDRAFLDQVATKIWAIDNRQITEYKGNYSYYKTVRAEKRKAQQHAYEQQQKQIERIEDQIKELTSWSNKAHAQSTKKEGFKEYHRVKAKRMDAQVKSKRKRLEQELATAKVEQVEKDYTVQFAIETTQKRGKRFLEANNLAKQIGNKKLFEKSHFTIQQGEKIALIGPNGCGKTTFLKMIVGEIDYEGKLWLSPTATMGYLSQDVFDLPLEQTPAQLFYRESFEARSKVQHLMKQLGFTPVHWHQSIQSMSMGERVKCKLMHFILQEKDALLLDEPTNHLDIESREQLEATLAEYTGTLIVVSHDEYFLQQVTKEQLVFKNGGLQRDFELKEEPAQGEYLLLALETERQAVLGKLSMVNASSSEYAALDQQFNELTKKILAMKNK